jgi:hypothetical protein
MELKEFITESLVQIADGISEANLKLKDSDACINPNAVQVYSTNAKAYGRVHKDFEAGLPIVELVDFDVSVQAEAGTQTGGGVKITIATIGLGIDGKNTDSHSSDSRIRFKIPMVYPQEKFKFV